MFVKLALLFILVPAVELFLLIRVGMAIGAAGTVGVILGTGALGAALARREGLRAWLRIQQQLAHDELPAAELVEAALIVAAGLVLLTPGLITDAAGFLLLVPPVRRWVRRLLVAAFQRRLVIMTHSAMRGQGPRREPPGTIETTARVVDDDRQRPEE